MANGTCKLADCAKPVKRNGFCYGHYMKNWRYGTPEPVFPDRHHQLVGERFGALVVMARVDGKWSCRCDCGVDTLVRSGDLNRGSVLSCGNRTTHHRAETIGYGAAHDRCRADRGQPSEFPCVDCGSRAKHWSYNHDDPNEMHGTDKWTQGIAYSADPMHYSPRCVPCHKRFDLDRIDAAHIPVG